MRARIRRLKVLLKPVEYVAVALVKTLVMGMVFLACAAVVTRWLGYPAPGWSDLARYFEQVTRLADLLS